MKNFLLIIGLALAASFSSNAQYIDLQLNPIGALFGNVSATAEFPLSENVGIEPAVGFVFGERGLGGYKSSGVGLGVNAKFYFSPDDGTDKFYAFGYTRFATVNNTFNEGSVTSGFFDEYRNTRLSLGVGVGYKWVADNGFIFELAAGGGRALLNKYDYDGEDEFFDSALEGLTQFDLYGRLSIGYRLGRG